MNKPEQLTYRDWLTLIPKKERQQCPQCHGNGEVKCSACGYEHPCELCGSDGFLIGGNPPLPIYIAQIEQERALYQQWMESIGQTEKAIETELTQ